MKRLLLLLLVTISLLSNLYSQPLIIDSIDETDTYLIQSMLGNCWTFVFNVEYVGDSQSFGYFVADANNFEIEEGLILSTGNVLDAAGPNDSGNTSTNTSGGSDSLLNTLIPQSVYDVARLNYSFISSITSYRFDFIFGSEEYLESINTDYNDVCGIFITGPDPWGGYYESENVLLTLGSNLPICINNANSASLYHNNGSGATPNNEAIQFDGYYGMFWLYFHIIPGETYDVSIVIGDAGNYNNDSGMFIRNLINNPPAIDVHFEVESPYGNGIQLFEGYDANLLIIRDDPLTIGYDIPVEISFGGNAIQGLDFNILSTSHIIPAGQDFVSIPLHIFNDFISEPIEQLSFHYQQYCNSNSTSLQLNIYDEYFFDAGIVSETIIACGEMIEVNTFSNAPDSMVSYLWNTGDTSSSILLYNANNNIENYYLTITYVDGNQIVDSVIVFYSSQIGLNINAIEDSCNFGSIDLSVGGGVSPYFYQWSNGATTQDMLDIPSGNYFVDVYDSLNCHVSGSVNLLSPPPLLNLFNLQSECTSMFGNIIAVPEYGNPPYSYIWNTSDTTNNLTGISFGNYFLTITDNYGCELTDSVIDFAPIAFSPYLDYYQTGCSPWIANLLISDGNPPYSILWSDGTTDTLGFSTTQTGTYWVSITDAYSCEFYQQFEFSIATNSSFNFNINIDYNTCGPIYNLVTLDVTPVLNTYTYLWSTGETADSIYNVNPGNYSVSVTDIYGCTQSYNFIVEDVQLQVNVTTTNVYDCNNMTNGSITLSPSGGTPPYSFLWSNGQINSFNHNLSLGIYFYTVTDACLDEYSDSVSIIYEPYYLELDIDFSIPNCNDSLASIIITEINSYPFNSWLTNDSGDTILPSYQGYFNNLDYGFYTIHTEDTFSCISDTFYINIDEIVLSSSSEIIQCSGDSIELTANIQNQFSPTGYNIEVLPLDTLNMAGNTIANLHDDRYYGPFSIGFDFDFFEETQTHFYIGSNGWISFSPLSSSFYDPWSVQPIPNPDPSRPRNAILAAYRDWFPDSSNVSSIKYQTVGTTPNRKLVVSFHQSLYSCWSTFGTFQIILYEGINIIDVNLVDVPTCYTMSSGLGVSGIQNASGTIASFIETLNYTSWTTSNHRIRYLPNNCLWYHNNNLISTNNTVTVSADSSGYYYCEAFSCDNPVIDSIYIEVLNYIPPINITGNQDLCYGDSLILSSDTGYFYLWNNANTTNAIEVLETGQYSVTVSDGVCSLTDSIFINIENAAPSPIYDSTMCASDTTIVYFDTSYTYQWSDGTSSNPLLIDTAGDYYVTMSSANCDLEKTISLYLTDYPVSLLEPIQYFCDSTAVLNPGLALEYQWSLGYYGQLLYVIQDGVYSVTMTNGHCSIVDSTMVYLDVAPIINLGQDLTICNGESVSIDAGNYISYLWSTGDTTQSIEVVEPNYYWVLVTDIHNCSNIDSINVDVLYEVQASFSFTEAFGTVEFYNQSQNATDYVWSFGDGVMDFTSNPIHTYPSLPNNEYYTVILVASNDCFDDETQFDILIFDIETIEDNNNLIVYPNPSVNTIYVNHGLNIRNYEIYNVTGQILIRCDFSNIINISQLSSGVYYLKFYTDNEQFIRKFVKR